MKKLKKLFKEFIWPVISFALWIFFIQFIIIISWCLLLILSGETSDTIAFDSIDKAVISLLSAFVYTTCKFFRKCVKVDLERHKYQQFYSHIKSLSDKGILYLYQDGHMGKIQDIGISEGATGKNDDVTKKST